MPAAALSPAPAPTEGTVLLAAQPPPPQPLQRRPGWLAAAAGWSPWVRTSRYASVAGDALDASPLTPPPPRPRGLARVVSVATSIAGICFGYEIGIVANVLVMDTFARWAGYGVGREDAAADITGWVVTSFLLGCCAGSLVAGWSADGIGRKATILLFGVVFTLGGAAQALAPALDLLLAARAVSGVAIGALSTAAPLLIAETAPAAQRGMLVAVEQLCITIGILLASVVNALLYVYAAGAGDAQWRLALAAQAVPGVLLLAAVAPLPRSPRWLASKGRRDAAAASLARLRGLPFDSPVVAGELADILAEIDRDAAGAAAAGTQHGVAERGGGAGDPSGVSGGARFGRSSDGGRGASGGGSHTDGSGSSAGRLAALLCSPRVSRPLLLAVLLQVCQQLTGINIGLYYSAALWERLGIDRALAATWLVVANSSVLVLATLPGLALLEHPRVGRRWVLIGGGVGMAVCHAAVAAAVSVAEGGGASAAAAAWVGVGAMMAFVACFSASWGPGVWVLQSELLPLDARAVGSAISTLANWAANAVIGKAAPYALAAYGPRTYAAFAAACALMTLYVAVALPETAGVPLEDIGALFQRPRRCALDCRRAGSSAVRPLQSDPSDLKG